MHVRGLCGLKSGNCSGIGTFFAANLLDLQSPQALGKSDLRHRQALMHGVAPQSAVK